jgi:mono/diheme cytochrome c family protein
MRTAHLPAGYERSALVALHGSWNRTSADGYKVVALHWRDDGSIVEQDFLTGFEQGGDVIGRPVDVATGPDGAIYVSDDYAGAIYRVAHGEQARAAATALPSATPIDDAVLTALSPAQRTELAAQGEQRYQQYRCAGCHEQRFAGGMRTIRPFINLSSRYTVQQLQSLLATPTPPMPVFPLSEEERKASVRSAVGFTTRRWGCPSRVSRRELHGRKYRRISSAPIAVSAKIILNQYLNNQNLNACCEMVVMAANFCANIPISFIADW